MNSSPVTVNLASQGVPLATNLSGEDRKMIEEASKMIGEEIPNLMKLMPAEDKDKESDGKTMITGGIFDDVSSFSFDPDLDRRRLFLMLSLLMSPRTREHDWSRCWCRDMRTERACLMTSWKTCMMLWGACFTDVS